MTSTFESYSKIGQIFSENIDDLIFIINDKHQCEYLNFEDFISKRNFNEFIHPDDFKGVNRLIKDIYKTGFGILDAQIKYKGNPFKWFEIKGRSFRDNEDNKKKVLLICREITKFKDIEFKMKKSQARFGELADYVPEIQFWKLLQTREGKSVVQKTREMLELVLDNIPQLIYWKDKNLVYMGCNKNFALLNQITEPTSIIGSTDEDLLWIKDNVKSIKSKEIEVMENDSAENNVIESLTLYNGKQTWFEINRIPLHEPKGKVVGILVTYEDITIREIAEQKLKESEEKYRGILENIKETYFEVDLEGNFIFFNDAFNELIGYSKNELLNSNYQNYVDEENKDIIIKVYNQVFKTSLPQSGFQFQFKKKNGDLVTCESSVYLSYDAEGNKVGFNGLARDITEKYNLEQKIKESEEKYRTIFNASPDYIFITDTKGNILDMNPALLERIGTTLNEVRGINFNKFYVGENLEELRKFGKILIDGKEIRGVEIKAKAYSGEIFEYEVNSVPLKEDGKVIKILHLARDITLRKQAEQKLRESEKKYRHLFESSPYIIWLMNEEGVIVDCNSTMDNLLSVLEVKDLIGRKFFDVLSVLKRSEYLINMLKNRFKRFLTGEKLGPLEFQITRVDGAKMWLSITSSFANIGDQTLIQVIIQNITEKKNAEQKIKESETKYRHLFEKSSYSIIIINRKGKIIDSNPATEKLFNRKKESLIDKNFLDINIKPEKSIPLFKNRYQSILQGVVPEPLEVQIARSKNHSKMWISIDDSLVEIGGETVFQVIIQDITEKKQAELELKNSQEELRILNRDLEQKVLERTKDLIKSEQQYRTTINSLSDPLHVVDKNLNIILANSAFDDWLSNLDIDKRIVGLKVFDAFPFLSDNIREQYRLVFDSGETLITEEHTMLEAAEIFTETRKIPIFSENQVIQVITIIRDITESKKMENQLIESEKNFRNMIINLDEGYYIINWGGNILYHNPAYARIAGYSSNENLIGHPPPFSWQKPEEREKYLEILQENEVIRNYIVQVKKKNGENIVLQINAHLKRDENDNPMLIEGTFSDITEKFRLEQELKESEMKLRQQNIELRKLDKTKNDFITMAAHELKTPLISISGYTDYILMKYRNQLNAEITRDLLTVQRNVNRLEILMDQLLDVLKIDENVLKLQKEMVNVSRIINDCIDELSYLINEKNLEIILDIDHEIILNIDRTRIFTVFTNLLSNAIKFTPDYGWVKITSEKKEDHYIFEIRDNGIGLVQDEIDRLFKKFERIKHPIIGDHISIKDSGTGLGLYITKGIINAHQGKIWANSEGQDKGSTFSFTLPF